MIPKKAGRIINIASIAGLNGNPPEMQTLAYNTSKSAVIGFTHTLAAEWGKYNINVNAICPGFFPSQDGSRPDRLARRGQDGAHAPLRRLGDDDDLKGVDAAVRREAGKHITGQWLAVDGGVSVGALARMTAPSDISTRCGLRAAFPSSSLLGFELIDVRRRRVGDRTTTATPEHLNSFDVTHGGACMTLLDVTMARRAQRRATGRRDGRGHDRDEDELHAAGASARWSPTAG